MCTSSALLFCEYYPSIFIDIYFYHAKLQLINFSGQPRRKLTGIGTQFHCAYLHQMGWLFSMFWWNLTLEVVLFDWILI